MNINVRVLLKIHGRVQGVFFRDETKKTAERLGLTGWVKNLADGTVECLVEGDKIKLKELITWCEQGVDAAKVDNIDIFWQSYQGEFNDFSITH